MSAPAPAEVKARRAEIQTRTLRALREHMAGIIVERDDMSTREARYWLGLLQSTRQPSRARWLGFEYIQTRRDIDAAQAALGRFVRIFQYHARTTAPKETAR